MTAFRPVTCPLDRPIKLGVLISGGGTTLVNFQQRIAAKTLNAEISHVIASRADCGGMQKAEAAGFSTSIISRGTFASVEEFSVEIFETMRNAGVDLVVLAGFLSLIHVPEDFQFRVINIHPSLIPAFCGRGFFGHKVHEGVLDRGVKITGCTVHFADNQYDHGPIILQKSVPVEDSDTPDTLAARVFETECEAYPQAIELFATGKLEIIGQRVHVRDDIN
jgi:phosphoribosylglycinamide formyltransferase 1